MNTANQSLEVLFDKIDNSKLPTWSKTTIAVSLAITPLLDILSKLILVKLVFDFIGKLFNFSW